MDSSSNDHASPMAADEQQYDLDLPTTHFWDNFVPDSSAEIIMVTGSSDGDGDIMIAYGDDDDAYSGGGFSAVPASGEAIEGLAKAAVGATREAECVVCMESFEEGDKISKMPCSHGFHESCISEWLRVSRVCPYCRFALPAEEKSTEPETEFEHSAIEEGYEEHPAGAHDDDHHEEERERKKRRNILS